MNPRLSTKILRPDFQGEFTASILAAAASPDLISFAGGLPNPVSFPVEAMDKAARAMGLDYPGGVNLDRVSKDGDPKSYKLPRPHVDGSEYDFSFSGLKTAAVNIIHNAKQKGEEISVPDLGASYIEAVVRCLRENTEKAALNFGFDKIVLAGGVSANSRLRAEMTDICKAHSWSLFMPELSLCGDNAAMVGAQGYYEFKAGNIAPLTLNARASMPIDEIDKFLSKKV